MTSLSSAFPLWGEAGLPGGPPASVLSGEGWALPPPPPPPAPPVLRGPGVWDSILAGVGGLLWLLLLGSPRWTQTPNYWHDLLLQFALLAKTMAVVWDPQGLSVTLSLMQSQLGAKFLAMYCSFSDGRVPISPIC